MLNDSQFGEEIQQSTHDCMFADQFSALKIAMTTL